jgi:hypothetical protein
VLVALHGGQPQHLIENIWNHAAARAFFNARKSISFIFRCGLAQLNRCHDQMVEARRERSSSGHCAGEEWHDWSAAEREIDGLLDPDLWSATAIVQHAYDHKTQTGSQMATRYGKAAAKKVKRAMHERKAGTLHSGRSGRKVISRKQAIAIGLSEARKEGAKVPQQKSSGGRKKK